LKPVGFYTFLSEYYLCIVREIPPASNTLPFNKLHSSPFDEVELWSGEGLANSIFAE
jgi:hypothetical protein